MIDLLFFLLSFIALWKSSDVFVDSSHSLAVHLKMPPILIGATVVAFGTSAPELFVTIFAALKHEPNVVYGNVFGSNIANIFLIFGLSLILKNLSLTSQFREQLKLNFMSLALVSISVYFLVPSRTIAASLLMVFLIIQVLLLKKNGQDSSSEPKLSFILSILLFFVSLFFLIGSSRLLVFSLLNVATLLGLSTTFLSLFAVAFGTSLPELVTTISFVRKNHVDIVIGNVFGSNFFNLLFVLPISWLVLPMQMSSHFFIEIVILFLTICFLTLLSRFWSVSKAWLGWCFIMFYLMYIGYIYYFVS